MVTCDEGHSNLSNEVSPFELHLQQKHVDICSEHPLSATWHLSRRLNSLIHFMKEVQELVAPNKPTEEEELEWNSE